MHFLTIHFPAGSSNIGKNLGVIRAAKVRELPWYTMYLGEAIQQTIRDDVDKIKSNLFELHFELANTVFCNKLNRVQTMLETEPWNQALGYGDYRFKHLENSLQLLSIHYKGKLMLNYCSFELWDLFRNILGHKMRLPCTDISFLLKVINYQASSTKMYLSAAVYNEKTVRVADIYCLSCT